MVQDHIDGTLSVVFELLQYSSTLQSSHWQAMSLLATQSDRCDIEHNRNLVLEKLRQEWRMVLEMEEGVATSSLLRKHCQYVTYQIYREVLTMVEVNDFKITPHLVEFLKAWYPAISSSAVVEDCFSSIQDAVKRSSKADVGSLPNMAAVAIRSLEQKTSASASLQSVSLEGEDFEGNQVRALKANVFRPDSCPSSPTSKRVFVFGLFRMASYKS